MFPYACITHSEGKRSGVKKRLSIQTPYEPMLPFQMIIKFSELRISLNFSVYLFSELHLFSRLIKRPARHKLAAFRLVRPYIGNFRQARPKPANSRVARLKKKYRDRQDPKKTFQTARQQNGLNRATKNCQIWTSTIEKITLRPERRNEKLKVIFLVSSPVSYVAPVAPSKSF